MGDPVLKCTGWLACESNSLYLKRSWERRVCDLKESSDFFFFLVGGITITLQNPLVSQFIYNMNFQFPISDLFKVVNILVFEAIHLYSFS